jgi:hypothetical protein
VLLEAEHAVAQRRGRREVARDQQQADEADDLLVGQPLPVHLGLDQPARQVVARAGPPGPDVLQEVGVHLAHDRRDGRQRLLTDVAHILVRIRLPAERTSAHVRNEPRSEVGVPSSSASTITGSG